MICETRFALLREFADAASAYSAKVHAMADHVFSGDEPRAREARRICRAAWETVEKSRLTLYRHEADHCCDCAVDLRNVSGV